ncbi:radical SAM family heme chaperone HemW [Sulfurimonas sp.]|uniref:radical SAM family heme chaperone HemW n=1 Tax=Sulfurimonas sp. TaxID=2022749 RepID=UPI002B48D807|nr:radical SAM family heme chaperone HemW [Sulfurimonas sp.]
MLLYIHIPFCDSKCSYCAFNSYVDKFHLKSSYMKALLLQLKHELKKFNAKEKKITTIFIGGGTPSTISTNLYEPLFHLINPYLSKDVEITSEANPNSANLEWLEEMYKLGVNRISFGVQSFNNKKLKLLNRTHNKSDAIKSIQNAKKVGFKNISLDLIYATLGDTKELLQKDLKIAFSLPVNHLSAYALTIEEGTPFESKPQMSKENLELTSWLFEEIKLNGFEQYEISNFGTYKSTHNLGYWKYEDYIGLGSGAVGKLSHKRFYPTVILEDYIKSPLQAREEELSQEDIRIEKIFLGFRSCVGVKMDILSNYEQERANILVQEKKLSLKNKILYNFEYLLADELALFLSS